MSALKLVDYRALVKVLELDGSASSRQGGDRLIYTKVGLKRLLVIPMYQDVPVFVINNVRRTAGMTRERYFDLLSNF